MLALALGRRGHRIIVLERESTPPTLGRPEILARSTVEAMQRLGGGTRLLEEAVLPLRGLDVREAGGRPLLTITQEDIQQAGVQPYSTDPNHTRRIMLEQAQATGVVHIERGVEVRELLRQGSSAIGVRAQRNGQSLEFHARLVVGDDGGHSRVRAGLGIDLTFHEFPTEFFVPLRPLAEPSPSIGRAWLNPSALKQGIMACIAMPLPSGQSAVALIMRPEIYDRLTPSSFSRATTLLASECEMLTSHAAFPTQWVRIRRPFGHAQRYVEDGAALLGDAAHPVTPVGGQGANMSVADALVLAGIADEALRDGDCSATRLSAYEAVRREANECSLQFSHRGRQLLNVWIRYPWLGAMLAPWLIRRNNRPEPKRRLLRAIASAFVSGSDTFKPSQAS